MKSLSPKFGRSPGKRIEDGTGIWEINQILTDLNFNLNISISGYNSSKKTLPKNILSSQPKVLLRSLIKSGKKII